MRFIVRLFQDFQRRSDATAAAGRLLERQRIVIEECQRSGWWGDAIQARIEEATPRIRGARTVLVDELSAGRMTMRQFDIAWGHALAVFERIYGRGIVGWCVHQLGLPFMDVDGYTTTNLGKYSPCWN